LGVTIELCAKEGKCIVHIYTCTFFSIMLYGHQKF
jgi:hypothetical protein